MATKENKFGVSEEVYNVYEYIAKKAKIHTAEYTVFTIREIQKVFNYTINEVLECITEMIRHELIIDVISVEPICKEVLYTVKIVPLFSEEKRITERLKEMTEGESGCLFDNESLLEAIYGAEGISKFIEMVLSGKEIKVEAVNGLIKISFKEEM